MYLRIFFFIVITFSVLFASDIPLIFPQPQEIKLNTGSFKLDENTRILIPLDASKSDIKLARFLTDDLVDKYYLPLQTNRSAAISIRRE